MGDPVVNILSGGMNTDFSPEFVKEGQHTFALNALDGNRDVENVGILSNENSNKLDISIPNRTIIGKQNISDTEIALFLVNDEETISEIAVYNIEESSLKVVLSDGASKTKLNFKLHNWIDTTYRVRRGCQKTIYFTDGLNTPKAFVFDDPEKYLDINGNIDLDLLSFNKVFNSIPILKADLKEGGFLKPGQYFVSIQYWDESSAQSDWMSTTNGIIIYNSTSNNIKDISGNIYTEEETYYGTPEKSTKSIRVLVDNIDPTYEFYKIAIACSYSDSDTIDEVLVSDIMHSSTTEYVFNGTNYKSKTTVDELIIPKTRIYSADAIAQHGYRLILGGIRDRDLEHDLFQNAANKVLSGCVVKKIDLNTFTKDHPSHSLHKINGGLGYTPGEVYSFGIVYVFNDGSTSPVYHIPGITKDYVTPEGTSPMSTDNTMDYRYTSSTETYWGSDYTGKPLKDQRVRHHRFPTRQELGVNVVDLKYDTTDTTKVKDVVALVKTDPALIDKGGTTTLYLLNKEGEIYENATISYSEESRYIIMDTVEEGTTDIKYYSIAVYAKRVKKIQQTQPDGSTKEEEEVSYEYSTKPEDLAAEGVLSVTISIEESTSKIDYSTDIDTHILGIQFSNVTIPESKYKDSIIGYFFVRHNREDQDKTVLASTLILPTAVGGKNDKYVGYGQVLPEPYEKEFNISKDTYALVYPEFLFNNTVLDFNEIEVVGEYALERTILNGNNDHYIYKHRKYGIVIKNDVIEGTTATKDSAVPDNDGHDVIIYTRNGYPIYRNIPSHIIKSDDIEYKFKIGALDNVVRGAKNYYNVTTDNKILLIKLKEDKELYDGHSAKYAILKNNHRNSYQNFTYRPYFKIGDIHDIHDLSPKKEFGGDNYTTPIHYTASNVYDIRQCSRATAHPSLGKVLGAIGAFVGGIALAVISGGTLAVVGGSLIALGAAALFASSEIKQNNLNKLLMEAYKDGLRNTIRDRWVRGIISGDYPGGFGRLEKRDYSLFGYLRKYLNRDSASHQLGNAEANYIYNGVHAGRYQDDADVAGEDGWDDDAVLLFSDTLSNIFFDSSINTYLRVKSNANIPSYVNPNLPLEDSTNKALTFHTRNEGKDPERDYIHTYEREPEGETDKLKFEKIFYYNPKEGKYEYRGLILSDFYRLNKSYSNINTTPYFAVGIAEHDTKCRGYYPYRVMWSEVSLEEDFDDKYLKFLSTNYKDLNAISGKITNLVAINQDLLIHTDKYLFKQPANYSERVTGDMTVYIGSGEFMANPAIKIGYIDDHYYLGLKHKLYSTVSSSGYYFVANDGNLYRFDSNLDNLSKKTPVYRWFVDNIQTENNYNNGMPWLHYGSGVLVDSDNRNDRILITCKQHTVPDAVFYGNYYIDKNIIKTLEDDEYEFYDYRLPYIAYKKGGSIVYKKMAKIEGDRDKEFTISYNILNENFVSFHSYIPDLYLSNGYNLFSYRKDLESIYRHNIKNSYQSYYGNLYPFIVEFATTKSPYLTSTYEFIKFKTVAIENIDGNDVVRDNITFNKALFYNSYQCSDIINLNSKKEQEIDQYTWMQVTDNSKYNLDRNEIDWSYNYIRNAKKNYNEPIFKNNSRIINSNKDIVYTKVPLDWSETEMLRDKYMITRLIFDAHSNIRLKYIYNTTDYIISER